MNYVNSLPQTCFIFGAGEPPGRAPEIGPSDLAIAADGGYYYTLRSGIAADALIGDFDSLAYEKALKASRLDVLRLPAEKDQTDTMAALVYGLDRGYRCFRIYGGAGGRLDHTLANIQCLVYLLNNGSRGYLHNGDVVATAVRGGIKLAPRQEGIISVFAIGGDAEGVSLRGLRYELENEPLLSSYPLGVSNEFIGAPVTIAAESGDLLICYPCGTVETGYP